MPTFHSSLKSVFRKHTITHCFLDISSIDKHRDYELWMIMMMNESETVKTNLKKIDYFSIGIAKLRKYY